MNQPAGTSLPGLSGNYEIVFRLKSVIVDAIEDAFNGKFWTLDEPPSATTAVVKGTEHGFTVDSTFNIDQGSGYLTVGAATAVSLQGAELGSEESATVVITLSEAVRVSAISLSDTPGGDGTPFLFNAFPGGIVDPALNPNVGAFGLTMTSLADQTIPVLINGTLDFNERVLSVEMSETIDAQEFTSILRNRGGIVDGSQPVNLSKIFLYDTDSGTYASLAGATVRNSTFPTFVVELTESQISDAVFRSGLNGGDGTAQLIVLNAGAMHDMSLNDNAFQNKTLVEVPDTIPPSILTASIDFRSSILSILVDEPVRLSTLVSTSFFLRDVAGDAYIQIQLNQSAGVADFSVNPANQRNLVVTLAETTRVAALSLSGQPRVGDGSTLFLDILAGGLTDLSLLPCATTSLELLEIPDTAPPIVRSVNMHYGTGLLTVALDETVDITPSSFLALDKLFLSQTNLSATFDLNSDPQMIRSSVDTPTLEFRFTELQRKAAIELSGTPGGDGTTSIFDAFGANCSVCSSGADHFDEAACTSGQWTLD